MAVDELRCQHLGYPMSLRQHHAKFVTVEAALDLGVAQWLEVSPAADTVSLSSLKFQQPGIWGHKVPWAQLVNADDRIELYRPLKVDPKVARRQRFKRQGKGRTGLFANRKSGSAAGY